MTRYIIFNNKDSQIFNKEFKALADVKEWIVNTLDLSLGWNVLTYQDAIDKIFDLTYLNKNR